MQRASSHGPSASPTGQINNCMEILKHLKVTVHNLAFVSITGEQASPAPYPFSTASLPPKMCVGMCVKLPSPTQHCHRNPPVRWLAHLHSCGTPSHIPREFVQSHMLAVIHHSLLTYPNPTPSPFTGNLLVLGHFHTLPRVGVPVLPPKHSFTQGCGCLQGFLDLVRGWDRCSY